MREAGAGEKGGGIEDSEDLEVGRAFEAFFLGFDMLMVLLEGWWSSCFN